MKGISLTYGLLAVMLLPLAVLAQSAGTQPPATVTVISPNGGETWTNGSTQVVKWKYEGTVRARMFRVLLSTDGGKSFPVVLGDNIPPTTMEFKWLVKAPDTDMAVVRVSAVLPVDNPLLPAMRSVDDNSDAPFSIISKPEPIINPPALTVVRPNGGEVWRSGARETIMWRYSGEAKVLYFSVGWSTDGGRSYKMIAEKLPANALEFKWDVARTEVSKTNLIKVTGYLADPAGGTMPTIVDVSDAPFAITN